MKAIESIVKRASELQGTVVLPEGMDPRVVEAACACADRKICKCIVLGTPEEIAAAEAKAGKELAARGIATIDYTKGDEALEQAYFEAWNAKEAKKPAEKQKPIDIETARKTLRTKRIYFGGMMVRLGRADGLVAGSIASTGDMLRAAFHTLGTEKGVKTASSCFIMDLQKPTPSGDGVLAFGDCAVIPDPTAEQLADIGLATAKTYRDLTGCEPRVAFLSYSTKGSAAGPLVEKVQKAVELARPRFAEAGIRMDGEMQFDAAIVSSVGSLKNPSGEIKGDANVFVFPDLQSGNIGYKIAQRIGGATAIGPNLQGLAKAMNDLSRGCSAEDIVGTVCVTLLQSASKK
ncbi:MAG: phosphate acetyltransferase [Kiritimatiellae bacterium]|nr:phosphate acetyltransferase [Kiritimatiellia bacterium]